MVIEKAIIRLPSSICINPRQMTESSQDAMGNSTSANYPPVPRQLADRPAQPSMSGLLGDLLWSDPQPEDGTSPSVRGVSVMWGPDITAR